MIDATPLLRLYTRYRGAALEREQAAAAQEFELRKLIDKALHTRFGREHRFDKIRNVADFQARVPLRSYEEFWETFWRPHFPILRDITWPGLVHYFAETSGTSTGRTKYIPVSAAMTAANRRAALDILVHHVRARPNSRILGGKTFILGGSTDLTRLAPGILSGDLSGIAAREVPFWARPRTFPPLGLAVERDWEKKVAILAQTSLAEDVRAISGTPTWILFFIERLMEQHPERPRQIQSFYPNLELIVHGGVGFAPYRNRFQELLQGSSVALREVYPASEGFVAIADGNSDGGLRPIVDNGLFYEFVPKEQIGSSNPARHWLQDAEIGQDYALVLSSNAGLWAYVLGDTVRLISRDPPRIAISGRLSYSLSAFGEHLTGEEVERAVSAAAQSIGLNVVDFTVAALMRARGDDVDAHLYVIEFIPRRPSEQEGSDFVAALDFALLAANADYAAHRQAGQLELPRIQVVHQGAFAAWMKQRGKIGGQHKVPRIMNDQVSFKELQAFAAEWSDAQS
jgi:hypothetical protein